MKMHLGLILLLVGGLLLVACGGQETSSTDPGPAEAAGPPTQEALVGVLRAMLVALEAGDTDGALRHILPPSGMTAEAVRKSVGRFLATKAISAAGIDRLSAEGRYGSLDAVFGKGGEGWAKRAGVDMADCYALALEDAQVAAFWDGTTFKVIRVDDVGKLK